MIELWLKALHVMAVISWMAGLFYLPRLFVYHVGVSVGSEASETFKVMERKLLKIIMNPAMAVAWLAGLGVGYLQDQLLDGWFLVKFGAVVLMSGFHGFLGQCQRAFEQDKNVRTEKFYRLINEVPTVLMIVIVIMVILKPF